jgi:hypothetical protein
MDWTPVIGKGLAVAAVGGALAYAYPKRKGRVVVGCALALALFVIPTVKS